jgi:uncharacterized membrane protein
MADTGATLESIYHDLRQDVAAVPVMELRDAAAATADETLLFTGGTFLASGAVWLGVERLVTEGWQDQLFGICLVAVVAGVLLSLVGYRQQTRRVTRLMRYCPKEIREPEAPAEEAQKND